MSRIINYKQFIENEFMIVPKEGGTPKPFLLNPVQDKYLISLKEDYPLMQGLRENILKARQEGFSALIDAIFAVDFLMFQNITGQIISHKEKETKALIQRVNFFIDCYLSKNKLTRSEMFKTDSKEFLENRQNGSELFIGTAGAKTLGRGDTLQNLHWSEVGFYSNTEILSAEKLVAGAEQQILTGVGKIFRESTGNVQGDFWYNELERSRQGEGIFKYRFYAWFENPEYRKEVENFQPTADELRVMEAYTLDKAQMYWYRLKMSEFTTKALGLREYPTIAEEAFLAAGDSFFDPDVLKYYYDITRDPVKVGNLAMDGTWI